MCESAKGNTNRPIRRQLAEFTSRRLGLPAEGGTGRGPASPREQGSRRSWIVSLLECHPFVGRPYRWPAPLSLRYYGRGRPRPVAPKAARRVRKSKSAKGNTNRRLRRQPAEPISTLALFNFSTLPLIPNAAFIPEPIRLRTAWLRRTRFGSQVCASGCVCSMASCLGSQSP